MSTLEHIQQGHWLAAMSFISFSFFAGWSIGFAVKTLLKVILLIFGLIIGAIVLLQYAEILPEVNWDRVSEIFRVGIQTVKTESVSVFEFAMQTLPGTTAFLIGAWFAWVKH